MSLQILAKPNLYRTQYWEVGERGRSKLKNCKRVSGTNFRAGADLQSHADTVHEMDILNAQVAANILTFTGGRCRILSVNTGRYKPIVSTSLI